MGASCGGAAEMVEPWRAFVRALWSETGCLHPPGGASCGQATEQRFLWALRDRAVGSPPCGFTSFSQWKHEQTETPGRVFAPSRGAGAKVRQPNQLDIDLQEASPETLTRWARPFHNEVYPKIFHLNKVPWKYLIPEKYPKHPAGDAEIQRLSLWYLS